MLISNFGKDYEIIKTSKGQKLERWGNITLLRPDPTIIWGSEDIDKNLADAYYIRSNTGGGYWQNNKNIPARWTVNYKNLTFNIKQLLSKKRVVTCRRFIKKQPL